MIHNVYSVFDSKAKAYLPPFFLQNNEVACRVFGDCANDPSHSFCKFAADFTLFKIGVFDDQTGVIVDGAPFVNLGLAAQFKGV